MGTFLARSNSYEFKQNAAGGGLAFILLALLSICGPAPSAYAADLVDCYYSWSNGAQDEGHVEFPNVTTTACMVMWASWNGFPVNYKWDCSSPDLINHQMYCTGLPKEGGTEETKQYTVTFIYDANGGTDAPETFRKTVTGTSSDWYDFTVSDVEPTRRGYKFLGWSYIDNAVEPIYKYNDERYDPGFAIKYGDTKTLYAVWQKTSEPTPSAPAVTQMPATGASDSWMASLMLISATMLIGASIPVIRRTRE